MDITQLKCDAIVNATNNAMVGAGNGVDGKINEIEGFPFYRDCMLLGGCETGKAKIIPVHHLPCKYVINTVGPIWQGGIFNEEGFLQSCYKESLLLAKKYKCKSVALPMISAGNNGAPKREVFAIALSEIMDFLRTHNMLVYLVVYDKECVAISEKVRINIEKYIEDTYADSASFLVGKRKKQQVHEPILVEEKFDDKALKESLAHLDESFSDMLFRLIDESGLTDSQVCKKANLDRKLLSKIRCNKNYKTTKKTILAFAVALELSLEDTTKLLATQGFALSHNNRFDIIVEYFIMTKKYNIFEINNYLFDFDQPLLGL
jgi:O-acetyl-ADP-ribose deacetylase (regulator of RNase III)